MPLHIADYLRPEVDVFIQSENGVIGIGPLAPADRIDTDLVDAGSRRITLRPGASIVDSSWSFAMIRGGHVDVTILGAFEVAANGDLANWDMRLPNKGPLVGGAMDLAVGARAVWVIMEHMTRKGTPRLVETCMLPLTAVRCVKRVYTDLAIVDIAHDGMVVREMLYGMTEADLRARTGAPFIFAPDCRPLVVPPIATPDRAPGA
jgi:3-oxoadipate CoA-transferase, beta subunit